MVMKSKAALVVLLLAGLASADRAPKPGTFYKESELRIIKKELKGSKIHMTFSTKKDRFYWCPGIKIKHTKKATIVLFVREKSSKNGSYDQKAKFDRSMTKQFVTIETKGLDTYIRNGERAFKKIHAAKQGSGNNSGSKGESKAAKDAKSTETKHTVILRSLEEVADLDGMTVSNTPREISPFSNARLSRPSEVAKLDKQQAIRSMRLDDAMDLDLDVALPATPIGDLRPSFSAPAKQQLLMNDFAKPIVD